MIISKIVYETHILNHPSSLWEYIKTIYRTGLGKLDIILIEKEKRIYYSALTGNQCNNY